MKPQLKTSFLFLILLTIVSLQNAIAQDGKRPNITILATGGTIAGAAATGTQAGYTSGAVTIDAMIWHQDRDNGGDFRYHPYDTIFDNSLTREQKVALSEDEGGRDNVSELAEFQTGDFDV